MNKRNKPDLLYLHMMRLHREFSCISERKQHSKICRTGHNHQIMRLGFLLQPFMIRLYLIVLMAFNTLPATSRQLYLHHKWTFRQVGTEAWYSATVPGTIHTDLMQHGLIPDPFYRNNEKDVQWVADKDWEYQTIVEVSDMETKDSQVYLLFEGLDTYADVYLNGQHILSAENMFRTYHINIRNVLQTGKNRLLIRFKSAVRMSDSIAAKSTLVRPCENNRHYARKAQYHFGWDWAPRLVTCGIWRPVSLLTGALPIVEDAAYSPVQLIQETDTIGRSFYFTVDGKKQYMKGANWVPADVFLPRITRSKYRDLLIAAKEANFNMLRVWGGGIYEDDAFYELCDSLGIYVWQDFMFAGAMYPADTNYITSIRQEVIDNILRLRKYRCIVLWCGNNEIDEAWHNWGWQKQFHIKPKDSIMMWQEYTNLFHKLLPELVQTYDPGRAYITTSPLYGWGRQKSMTEGDSHYWGLWWGMDSIAAMKHKIPRFMSEFGMQAMPVIESISQFAIREDMDTSSAVMRTHQKHPTGFSTLNQYLLMEKIPVTDFMSFVDGTQELQTRALETAIKAQRNSKQRCMGTLIWQFNDCWPVCSWSIIDYYGRKKKSYNTVQKLFKD
jgi:beta-mannosidase